MLKDFKDFLFRGNIVELAGEDSNGMAFRHAALGEVISPLHPRPLSK